MIPLPARRSVGRAHVSEQNSLAESMDPMVNNVHYQDRRSEAVHCSTRRRRWHRRTRLACNWAPDSLWSRGGGSICPPTTRPATSAKVTSFPTTSVLDRAIPSPSALAPTSVPSARRSSASSPISPTASSTAAAGTRPPNPTRRQGCSTSDLGEPACTVSCLPAGAARVEASCARPPPPPHAQQASMHGALTGKILEVHLIEGRGGRATARRRGRWWPGLAGHGWVSGGLSVGEWGVRGGFQVVGGADLDLLGLGFFGLGDQDLQHAAAGRGLDRVGHDGGWQGDWAAKAAVAAFDAAEVLLGGVVGEVPLALDGEQAAFHGDLDVVELDARELYGDQVGVLALGDVQRGHPGRGAADGGALALAVQAQRVGQRRAHLVQLVLRAEQVLEGVPLGSANHLVLPRAWSESADRRLGDNAVRVRETGSLAERPHPMVNIVHCQDQCSGA